MKVIGIAGASGSGKSLLARAIQQFFSTHEVSLISEDCYYQAQNYVSFEQRTKTNYDHPDAMDHALMIAQVNELRSGEAIHCPVYDFKEHCRDSHTTLVRPPKVLLLEGILLFNDARVRDLLGLKVFLDVPLDTCLLRRLQRDVSERGRTMASVLEQYQNTVRPGYLDFVLPTRKYADVLIPGGGENQVAVAMLIAHVQKMVN